MSLGSLVMVLAWILMGLATGYLAEKKGRNFPFWFVIGAAFGVFGLLVLVFLPKVGESFKTEKKEPKVIEVTVEEIVPQENMTKKWFYVDLEGAQKGPVFTEALRDALKEGAITEESYVWSQGMKAWKPLKDLDVLK